MPKADAKLGLLEFVTVSKETFLQSVTNSVGGCDSKLASRTLRKSGTQ